MHNSLELQLVCCLLFVLCASLNLNLYSGEESIIKNKQSSSFRKIRTVLKPHLISKMLL